MTPDQFRELLAVLAKIADKNYTITGAADWPMLVICVGAFGGMLTALICFMWRDLGKKIDSNKTDNDERHKNIWDAMKDCQDDCCPRGKS